MSATLDRLLPEYAFRSAHHVTVAAPPPAVWEAVRHVTPGELPLTRILTGLRALPARLLGHSDAGRIAAADRSVVDQFVARGFAILHEDVPRSLAVGAAGMPWHLRDGIGRDALSPEAFAAFSTPGAVRMAMAFDLTADGDGTRLETETRVAPTDRDAAKAFGRYWSIIRPGSALIRLDMLRAIKLRAERAERAAE